MMKDLSIELTFYQCRGIGNIAGLKSLVDIVFESGFEFEQNVNGRMHKIQRQEQIEDLVTGHYRVLRTDSKTNLPTKWRLTFPAHPKDMQDLIGTLEFYQFNEHTNRLVISALIDFEFADQGAYVEPYTQLLRQLSLALYPHAKPGLGWIDREEKDVRNKKLSTISWCNIFGINYASQYGGRFLLELPGRVTELLADGGVFHQLSETFSVNSQKEGKAIQQEVVRYCAAQDVKVKCYAPYHLRAVN
jgi:hypothetical protein